MLKIKHERDCDCVVAGFRWYKDAAGREIGSLLLGLYNDAGALQHVGVCASFTKEKRGELLEFLTPYRMNALADHPWKSWAEMSAEGEAAQRMPGGQSRWSQGKDLSWEPVRPELVVEVAYEHIQAGRFRHMAQFRRWRLDKPLSPMHVLPTGSRSTGGVEVHLCPGAVEAAPGPAGTRSRHCQEGFAGTYSRSPPLLSEPPPSSKPAPPSSWLPSSNPEASSPLLLPELESS